MKTKSRKFENFLREVSRILSFYKFNIFKISLTKSYRLRMKISIIFFLILSDISHSFTSN